MTLHSEPELDTVKPLGGGLIGLTPCPGIFGGGIDRPPDARIESDLQAIRAWGAQYLITLMESFELIAHQSGRLGGLAQRHFGETGWLHLPVPDGGVPDRRWERWWAGTSDDLHACLETHGRIAIHCLAGIGRTGLVACRLLVERGTPPTEALQRIRRARPGAVESVAQENYVLSLSRPGV